MSKTPSKHALMRRIAALTQELRDAKPSNESNTEREAKYPSEVVEAWHWIKTYCRHWATVGTDWQTLDNLGSQDKEKAKEYLTRLRAFGLLVEGGPRHNFVVREL